HAARRHTDTQTGLVLPLRKILATDHTPTRLLPEALHLVHWGGRLSPAQESTVARHRPPHTVTAAHWLHRAQLADNMQPDHHRRTTHALDALTRGAHLQASSPRQTGSQQVGSGLGGVGSRLRRLPTPDPQHPWTACGGRSPPSSAADRRGLQNWTMPSDTDE
ncbi:hypothetical protein, partial [Kitasatospora purpeofusca]|uniref:hypothetical protein n=1 Tax=Kitasatospora purpeofusca TaxID=67352 RepID=UPI0012FF2EF7